MSKFYAQTYITQKSGRQKSMYFPDRGCVHTLLTLYVYATGISQSQHSLVTVLHQNNESNEPVAPQ